MSLWRCYALFFIAHDNRRVWVAGCTTNSTGEWATQQARNLGLDLPEQAARFLIRDRDSKYSGSFDLVFRSEGIRSVNTLVRAPKANALAERFVRSYTRRVSGPAADPQPPPSRQVQIDRQWPSGGGWHLPSDTIDRRLAARSGVFLILLAWGPTGGDRRLLGVAILAATTAIAIEALRPQNLQEFPEDPHPAVKNAAVRPSPLCLSCAHPDRMMVAGLAFLRMARGQVCR